MSPKKEKLILRTPSPLNKYTCDPTTPPKAPIPERIKTIRLPKNLKIPSFNERLNSALYQYQFTKQEQLSSLNSIIDSNSSLETTTSQTKYVYGDDDDDKKSTSTSEIYVKDEPVSPYIDQYIYNQTSINLNIFEETDYSSTSSHSSKKSCNISAHNTSSTTSQPFKLYNPFISPSPPPSPTSSVIKIKNDIIPETSTKSNILSPSKLPLIKPSPPRPSSSKPSSSKPPSSKPPSSKPSSYKSLSSKSSPDIPLRPNNHRHRIKMKSIHKPHKVKIPTSYKNKGNVRITHRFNKIKSMSDTSDDELELLLEERKTWINRLRPRNYNKVTQDGNCKVNSIRTTKTHESKYSKPNTRKNTGIEETKRTDQRYRQQPISHLSSLPLSTTTSPKMDSTSVQIRRSTRILKSQNSS